MPVSAGRGGAGAQGCGGRPYDDDGAAVRLHRAVPAAGPSLHGRQLPGHALAGRPVRIMGDGSPVRSYMYAAEMAAWLWTMLADDRAAGGTFNVGSAQALSLRQVAGSVARAVHPSVPVTVLGATSAEKGRLPAGHGQGRRAPWTRSGRRPGRSASSHHVVVPRDLERRTGSMSAAPPPIPLPEGSVHGPIAWVTDLCRRRREQTLYLVVGAWNTLFGYTVWAIFEYLLHDYLHYLVILVLSWPFAVLNAYVCYRLFVFPQQGQRMAGAAAVSLVYVVTLCAGLLALPLLLRTLPFNIYVIQAGYTVVVVILSYLSHKFFSFGGNRKRTVVPEDDRTEDERT